MAEVQHITLNSGGERNDGISCFPQDDHETENTLFQTHMRMLTGYWYICTYSTLHQHKKTHLSMLTHMLVQTTELQHAALSPPSGTEDNCIHDRIIFHFYSGFIL